MEGEFPIGTLLAYKMYSEPGIDRTRAIELARGKLLMRSV